MMAEISAPPRLLFPLTYPCEPGGGVDRTNGPVHGRVVVFADSERRGVSARGIFRDDTQPGHRTPFPRKTAEAAIGHRFLAPLVPAPRPALRPGQAHGAPEAEPPAKLPRPGRRRAPAVPRASTRVGGEGSERWRRRLRAADRAKGVVLGGGRSGIFPVCACAVLAGWRLRPAGIPPARGSPSDIRARHGLSP
jgi:hypothetical protein